MTDLLGGRIVLRIAIAAFALTVLPSSVRAKDWFHYETSNFELLSEGRKNDAKEIITELELLHQIMSGVVGNRRLVERKTKVVIFAKERDLLPFHPDSVGSGPDAPRVGYHALWLEDVVARAWNGLPLDRLPKPGQMGQAGEWQKGMEEVFDEKEITRAKRSVRDVPTLCSFSLYQDDASLVLLSWEPNLTYARTRIFRAYAQTMLRSVGISGPPWFFEGMAEMMKNMDVELDTYLFGIAEPWVVELAQAINYIMPIEDMMALDDSAVAGQSESARLAFAAQSWLLVHYCYFGDVHGPQWRIALLNLLAETNRGERDYADLLTKHLEVTPQELAQELFDYKDREIFAGVRQRYPEGWQELRVKPVKVSMEEMEPLLEEIKVRLTRPPDLRSQWEQQIENDSITSRNRYLWGLDRWLAGEPDLAVRIWDGLDDDYPKSALVLRAPAQSYIDGWLQDPNFDQQLSAEDTARYRRALELSLEQDPSDQSTMMYLAWLEALSPEPSVNNVNLVQRSVGGMTQPELTLLAIARIRMRLGDLDTARTLVYEFHDRKNWPWVELVDAMEELAGLWDQTRSSSP